MVGSKFDGFLPPHPNVRVYEIFWLKHAKQPEIGMHQEPRTRIHTEEDLDKNPMPTMRTIPAEFVPCVIAIYRDIVRDYADSSYEQRNRIWNCILSAMKHSLATIRDLSGKKGDDVLYLILLQEKKITGKARATLMIPER